MPGVGLMESFMSEVHFLPWAEIKQHLAVGSVTIAPWADIRTQISDAERKFLDLYFRRHITHDGHPVDHIAVAWTGSNPIAALNVPQRVLIRRAIDALIFVAITTTLKTIINTTNTSMGVPHSERFQLVTQVFKDTEPFVAVSSGGTLHGWRLNDIHFCTPWHMGSALYSVNDDLLAALGKLLRRPRGAKQRERIFRALEWFRLAHSGNDETSDQSRVVMMATAFEILLEPADPFQKRRLMTQALHTLTDRDNLRQKTLKFGKKKIRVNAVAVWLDRFYQLRNAIVHGSRVTPSQLMYPVTGRPWLTHLKVAALVLWEAISWELANDRLLGNKAKQHADWLAQQFGKKHADKSLIRQATASLMGINTDEYHVDLGWTKSSR